MNPRLPPFAAWVVALTFGALSGADAAEYTQVNTTASTLSFTYNQFSSRVYGTFSQFEGRLDFDTANPSAAHAALTIQLDSIDAGSIDANEELKKPAWFDTANSPVATFESTAVKSVGNDRYSITGQGHHPRGGSARATESRERHRHLRWRTDAQAQRLQHRRGRVGGHGGFRRHQHQVSHGCAAAVGCTSRLAGAKARTTSTAPPFGPASTL